MHVEVILHRYACHQACRPPCLALPLAGLLRPCASLRALPSFTSSSLRSTTCRTRASAHVFYLGQAQLTIHFEHKFSSPAAVSSAGTQRPLLR